MPYQYNRKVYIYINLFLMSLFFIACAPIQKIHGNIVDEKRLAQLKVDETTQKDALQLLGTPSTTSTIDTQTWFYIGQKTARTGIYKENIEERRVVILDFNPEGVLKNVHILTERDGHDVEISSRETPSTGRQFTIMQQLIGNLGRFNKSDFEGK